MAWSTALVVLLAIVAAFYLFGGSIVLWLSSLVLKNWRYTSRGFEWDKDTDAVIPTLLIRRFSFHWGGRKAWSKGGSGLLVLKASGISFRRGMEHDGHERTDEPAVKSPSSLVTLIKTSILPPILNLLLHHSSWLPSLFQVQLCDIRIINDDLGGLEGTVEDITLSLQVDFKGFEAAETPCPTGIASPRTIYHRGHPLEMSPPTSPTIFTNFAHPFSGLASPPSPSTPLAEHPEQRSRFDQARRRATSGFNSSIRGIASSASHYWTRAIGRAHGSVTCTVDIVGVAVILPDSSSPITGRSRSASEDETSMLQKRPRALSLRSMPSMPSIFRRSASPYLPSDERGYEKLASLRGRSMAKVSMAFGPHIGLLGESSFNTSIELAELKSNLASMEKIRDILARRKKARGDASKSMPGEKDVEKKLHKNFASAALPRILLRAFDSVSLAIRCVNLSHFIPSTHHAPPDSGSSDATLTPDTDQPGFTVALDVEDVRLAFNAADATNSEFAKAAFGNSTKCESRVRGIGYELEWQNVSLHCVSPGEIATDRIELVAVRQASFRGISTWRPVGWSREELLFANDPNLSLLVLQSDIASLDGAADVQMLSELRSAWRASRPVCKPKETADTTPRPPLSAILGLPPRLEATLEIGNIMFVLGDRVAGQRTALSIASEGLNIGISTTFEDIIGRRRDGTGHRRAFNEEEALYGRRNATTEYDAALPPAMQRPAFRRTYRVEQAVLQDDLAIRMLIDSQATIKPVAIHLTLGDQEPVSHKLASIGQIHAAFDGAVSGVVDVRPDGSDLPRLMMSTLSSSLDLGVDAGVQLSLADGAVIDALQAMGVQHRQHSVPTPPSEPSATFLDQMPAGVSSRISIGTLSVFVGHPDVYPNGKLDLVRGVFLQTAITFEYAYYTHRSQCIRHRLHVPKTAQRKSLRLDEDIATQAVACFNEYSDKGGRAVLATATCSDVLVRPIYSATGFAKAGGVGRKHRRSRQTAKTRAPGFQAFDFRHFASNDEVSEGDFANMDEEDEVDPAFQARRPLVQVPQLRTDLSIVRPNSEAATEIKILPKLDRLAVVGDMSHVYCCLLANLAIQKLAKAWRRPTAEPVHARSVMAKPRVEIWIPVATLDITFPLHERLFFHIKGLSVSMLPGEGTLSTVEQAVVYVPSPADKGQFEEYLGIQSIRVVTPPPDKPPAIDVSCDSLRLHIPYSYVTAKPVLNINVTIKAMKTLLKNMRTGSFSTSHEPAAEQPKIVPPISFSAKAIRIEFADNALEQDLNLIFRAGQVEQQRRNDLEDVFERKVNLVSGEGESSSEDSVAGKTKLTRNSTVSLEQAREGLDKAMAVQWKERIAAAQRERRRRVEAAGKRYRSSEVRGNLPVKIRARPAAHPLFSVTWSSAKIQVTSLGKKREEVVQLMSDLSAPFAPDSKFSLMVPLHIRWTMEQAEVKLRDYPLPLISVPASGTDEPSWLLETPFIIAEELHGPDTWFAVPTEIVPENLGAYGAKPLFIQVQKTITPVKTYARPHLQINAATKTDFTWGNSYQPAIQDLMRVIDTISHPPKDPSDKPGFWDKFRLTLHWQVQMDFKGPLHLHLKGSYDPYNVTGHGTGFAVVWKSGTQVRIAQPNPEYETIQITSDELLVVIPDLTSLSDSRATGTGKGAEPHVPTHRSGMESEEELIRRRYTKPCARFLGGVRVGFGFRFERTCREWSCRHNCGATENLARRRCRIFDFKKHQDVIMRNPQAVEQAEQELGHASDSLEGFRSDFIHFSISTVLNKPDQARLDSSSMHFTPKATAHFLAWWRLFNSTMSLPIRHGKLFPNSPPPSKKFGRNIATIKYRFDLHDMYLSHMYTQIVPELWKAGKTRSLGVKGKIGRWRMDLHQRRQERIVKNEKLGRTNVVAHKPFYAINLMLDDIQARLIQADFLDIAMRRPEDPATAEEEQKMVHADKLPESQRIWYNFFDYIDADRKPFDQNPKILVTELADCPHIFWSKRVKAVQISRDDEDESSLFKVGRPDIESTKFGREESHICYMDQVPGIAETQTDIARKRVRELQHDWSRCGSKDGETATDREAEERNLKERLRNLHQHMHRLASEEHREIDNETLVDARDLADNHVSRQSDAEHSFENEVHIHNAKLFLNNTSRNMAYRYYYSNQDRKREEYTSSYASLRSLRDERYRRLREEHMRPPLTPNEKARDDVDDAAGALVQELANLLKSKPGENMFRMPSSIDTEDKCLRLAKQGLPRDARAKAKNRILLLNPQIALRSELDDKSIVLLAVNEVSFRGYQVVDEQGADAVSADIMSRNFISMKGLEGFYPSAKTMQRHHENKGFPRTLDFLPLEILLDTKSEATEYDRIVQRTDAALAVDKFNHLRMPRGIEWPQVLNDFGEPIKHLTLHQDLTTVVIPRLTVSATSTHYTALYNIVTDLLLYKDPRHRARSDRIDGFMYTFDNKDRNIARLIMDLWHLQRTIQHLHELAQGYEANADLITDEGKRELFNIRTDLLDATEQLFTVFEAVSINAKRDDARAELITSHRLNAAAGGIAWHMLRDNLQPLEKLDIAGTLFSHVTNTDGSTDSGLAINELAALNSNPDAEFHETLVRYEPMGRKAKRDPFASAAWSISTPVGGIDIWKSFTFAVQPINVRIEERVGKQVLDYVFNDRVRRRQEQKTKKHEKDRGDQESIISSGSNDTGMSRGTKDLELSRTQSSASIASSLHPSMMNGSNGDQSRPQKFAVVHSKDALEMKNRASKTKTFENIRVAPTVFMLSYQRDDSEKHSAFPLPECVDVQLRLPELNYVSKTWGFEDIVEAAKRDLKSHAWAQSASLLNQAFRKTSMFRSKKALRKLASLPSQINVDLSRLTSPPGSKLRHAIDPSAADDDNTPTPTGIAATPATGDLLHRALSRKSSRGDPMLSPQGRRGSIPGSPRASKSPEWRAKSTDNESDRDPEETLVENHSSSTAATRSPVLSRSPASQHYDQDEDEGGGKTGLRGLLGLGRFGRKKAESTDDLSSGSMVNRQHRRPSNADLAGSPPTTAAF